MPVGSRNPIRASQPLPVAVEFLAPLRVTQLHDASVGQNPHQVHGPIGRFIPVPPTSDYLVYTLLQSLLQGQPLAGRRVLTVATQKAFPSRERERAVGIRDRGDDRSNRLAGGAAEKDP